MSTPREREPLEIIEQRTMVEIPRGEREALRVEYVRAHAPDGKEVCWHSVRLFWRGTDGQMHPGRQGVTVRGRELVAVAEALSRAASGGHAPSAAPASTSAPARRPEHRESRWPLAPQTELPARGGRQ